ncbi:monovalent cation:proton antiporter-2 (CPA2) family protein [Sediminibacterium ginsengisoli]|uniref:Kef-type potassium/proton antiporter, CPA2 family n=1 Tax=Sediminibacterium ginsengisoli TaxID=413434 RepID=A0A1T4RL56_9BACT|nr:monovalent cation:proton antiporter-2 (CPA2) family protein [Sediminibacterium ginsengisoli]SKA16683.1 Kef-type potassium/proton antiporter, CPA2 family [Sediminibacterium ginsengisoli]
MQDSFIFQAMIYLAAAVILVPLAKKTGLGTVLGYLIAGVLIGPACFRFIGSEGQDLMHFAEFGVVMLLFVIGLELEPSRLWRMRKTIAGMGGLQVGITGVVVTAIALLLDIHWKQAVALGMIVSMSSTAIVLQSLNEKGLMKSAAGESSFAVLLFQDIAVIPMLALFPLLSLNEKEANTAAHGSSFTAHFPAWAQTLFVFGSVLAVVVIGRYLVRPFFRFIARMALREMFTAAALLLVVGTAVLMTSVGLSPALGAFLAGVMLANSEYRHELESDIDPFKGLLLGLFFIAVGASIDFNLIYTRPLLIFGLVLGVMLVKMLVLFFTGKVFRMTKGQNAIFSFGLLQIGEFAFVLLSFSSQEGILSKELTDTMVAVVAISMALTPLAMLLNEKLILPRICSESELPQDEREPDVQSEENPVIIAGYGNFGNTVGRFLRAHQVGTTVLDVDSDNVDTLRRMGFKVYYGDASRRDLLEIAGARKAKLIIIAINDEEKRKEMIETIKKHFPNLRMLVRASNRQDAYDLMNAGMLHIYRETLDTSIRVGIDAMRMLGYRAHETTRSAKTFFVQDEKTLRHLSSIRNDEEYVNAVRKNTEELEAILQADHAMVHQKSGGWEGR